MAALITAGTAEEASAEFALADGATATVNLAPSDTAAVGLAIDHQARIQLKTAAGGWLDLPDGRLTAREPAKSIPGPGTFRVIRSACMTACAVDKS